MGCDVMLAPELPEAGRHRLGEISLPTRIGIAAIGAGIQLAYIFWIDSLQGLDSMVGPLFKSWSQDLGSCLVMATLFFLGSSGCAVTRACVFVRSIIAATIVGFYCFELEYFASRIPPISEVSYSLSLRPWTRIVPICTGISLLTFCVVGFLLSRYRAPSRSHRDKPA
jgi:hypothetical protein